METCDPTIRARYAARARLNNQSPALSERGLRRSRVELAGAPYRDASGVTRAAEQSSAARKTAPGLVGIDGYSHTPRNYWSFIHRRFLSPSTETIAVEFPLFNQLMDQSIKKWLSFVSSIPLCCCIVSTLGPDSMPLDLKTIWYGFNRD